jgi:hypothetical protein
MPGSAAVLWNGRGAGTVLSLILLSFHPLISAALCSSPMVASPSCHVTLLPLGGPFNARGVERRRERRDVRCVTVRQPGRAGIASSGMPGASPSAGVRVPFAAHGPVSGRQSGSNSPPGPYLLLSVSRQPISLWPGSAGQCRRGCERRTTAARASLPGACRPRRAACALRTRAPC